MADTTLGSRGGRLLVEALGFVILAYFAYAVVMSLWPEPERLSAAESVDLIVAPGVSVDLMPAAKSLDGARFTGFDVAPNGAIVVSTETATAGRVVDMANGEAVFTDGTAITSFAFVAGELAAVDSGGRLGVPSGGRFQPVDDAPVPGFRLGASSDGSRLFFLRTDYDGEGDVPALLSVVEGAAPEVLTGSFDPLKAVGGDALQTYFSLGGALFELFEPGRSALLFALPDASQSIVGIGASGGALYFATERAVYTLVDQIVLPLVIGIGGDLRILGSDLYVLDSRQARVYRIALSTAGRS